MEAKEENQSKRPVSIPATIFGVKENKNKNKNKNKKHKTNSGYKHNDATTYVFRRKNSNNIYQSRRILLSSVTFTCSAKYVTSPA